MKVGWIQGNAIIGDFKANVRTVVEGYATAVNKGARLVVTPELFLCGYPPRDLLLRPDFLRQAEEALQSLSASIGEIPLLVGTVTENQARPGKPLRNSAVLLRKGKVAEIIHKTLLPAYDVFEEDRYFEPADSTACVDVDGIKVGVTICEDIWNDADFWPDRLYRQDPVRELIQAGAEMIVNLSASPWHQGKQAIRRSMLERLARDEGRPILQVNMVGANDELVFDGNSIALDASGKAIAQGAAFAEEVRVVDLSAAGNAARVEHEDELLYKALVLGIRDYVNKCGFPGVALGLSGGIDSALVAALAADALGPEKVFGVALPSQYSSEGSRSDAFKLAKALGIRHDLIAIEPIFDAAQKQLEGLFAGKPADVTEENLQSRIRGLLLMAISNKFGSLILTTGNKSEMAVGYCTLYGDMCGAFAPICDVWKTEVYRLSKWINREREIIPVDSIVKPPSAELRPNQTDQDSLPPYEVLDAILQAHVVEQVSAEVIVGRGYSTSVVADVLRKVTFSEYKRRQAAPGLKVSARAFGMGRRIPIAQRFRG